jgi:hypothetical protein
VSMVGASELVMPPPYPRAMQDQADLESSRASSASDVSTLGGRSLFASFCLSLTLSLSEWGQLDQGWPPTVSSIEFKAISSIEFKAILAKGAHQD